MDTVLALTIAAVVVTLFFDFTNGRNDAANIIATVIASRAMTPVKAVLIVAFFEFLGPLLSGTAVANAIGKFVHLDDVAPALALTVIALRVVCRHFLEFAGGMDRHSLVIITRPGRRVGWCRDRCDRGESCGVGV